MNLEDLLAQEFSTGPKIYQYPDNPEGRPLSYSDYSIEGEALEELKKKILKCEEFKEVDDFEIMKAPNIIDPERNLIIGSMIHPIRFGDVIKNCTHIHSISLSEEVYQPHRMMNQLVEESALTPTLYDELTFKPYKVIIVKYDPDKELDEKALGRDDIRKEIHSRIDQVLDKPLKYTMQGFRYVMIRGLFEIESNYKYRLMEVTV